MRVSLSSRRTSLPWFLIDRRWRPQLRDQPQDIGEQNSGNDDLGHLEGEGETVANDLRADLDESLLEGRQRQILDIFVISPRDASARRSKMTAPCRMAMSRAAAKARRASSMLP